MVFPIVGGTQSTGYEISNSLRFNDGDSPSLAITPGSAGDRKTFTYSGWVKRSSVEESNGQDHLFMVNGGNADDTWFQLRFEDNDLVVSSYNARIVRTNRKFRDPSAWYHIVVAVDTTQGTDTNRVKLYVNGVQETSFSTTSYPSQDSNTGVNGTYRHFIGAEGGTSGSGSGNFYDGYMTEVHLVDGSALNPTSFGEFDDNGLWVPIKYTGTYGTNGFFLEFKQTGTSQNSSGIGADTSGNDNHFAVTNLAALDVTEDTCTNNFATLVPALNMTLSEGNVKAMTSRTGNWDGVHASIGLTSGKWYFETKASTSGTFRVKSGIVGNPETFTILYNGQGGSDDPLNVLSNTYPSYGKGVWLEHWYDQNYNSSSTASSQSSGDILQFALDMDNYKMWIGVNGQFKDNSNNNVSYSDVASGSSATVTIASAAYTGKTFFPDVWLRDDAGSDDNIAEINFGNPSFAISSGNTDGKYGNFEYAVPSGFYAICTKRLAEFG